MKSLVPSETKRLRACFLLCMLCTLCTNLHLIVGMEAYEKIWFYTSDVQLAASIVFLILAVRQPLSRMAGWHLAYGIAFTGWLLVTKYMHALYGEPPEIVGLFMSRYLVLLPFAELTRDGEACKGLKGAAVLTWGVCLWLVALSVLLLLDLVPQGLRKYVFWSGARMNTLWNPIIFATILFMGIALCVAALFVASKRWQRATLAAAILVQYALITLTHSRTVLLCLCAFTLGTCVVAMGQWKLKKMVCWLLVGILLSAGIYGGGEVLYSANNQRLIAQIDFESSDLRINEQGYITDGITNQGSLAEDIGSLNGRSYTWGAIAWQFSQSKDLCLFGTSRFRDRVLPGIAHAHNSWLQMLVQMGIPGLLLSLALTVEILLGCARVVLRCRDKAKIVMTMWVLAMLPIGFMEPFLFNVAHVGDLFILTCGYLWCWGARKKG